MMCEEEAIKNKKPDPNVVRFNNAFATATDNGKDLAKEFYEEKKEKNVNTFADYCFLQLHNSLFTDEDLILILSLIEAGMHIQHNTTIAEIDQKMNLLKIQREMQQEQGYEQEDEPSYRQEQGYKKTTPLAG